MASAQTTTTAVANYIAKYQASNSRPLQSSTQNGRLKTPDLPTEMLLHITNYLEDHESVCFALSCRKIYNKLGNNAFKRIPRAQPIAISQYPPDQFLFNYHPRDESHGFRGDFLYYLQKDLLDVTYCFYCDKLHKPKDQIDMDPREGS